MSREPAKDPAGPRPLFTPLSAETAEALAAYPALLRRVLPHRANAERELPRHIRDLSLSLTAEREGGPRPGYLSDPRTLSAYAWYFLPWNLLRLCRLLPGLDLDIPEGGLVRDLGAGPLTLLQALWLSRPELRRKRLRFVCADRSRRALDLGLRLFAGLAGFDPTGPDAPWRVRCLRGEYWQGLGEGTALTSMVNVANELADSGREPLAERMERLAGQLADTLAPGGRLLLVEPGTRLGWRCLAAVRTALLEMGLSLAAPCPHDRPCPLEGGRVRAWCHFTTPPRGAPAWLAALSDRAGLAKERLSLSFLLAGAGEAPEAGMPPQAAVPLRAARVVSGAFAVRDVPGSAVYACSAGGLLVLVSPDRRPPRSGDLLSAPPADGAPLDAKSGAPRLLLPAGSAPADASDRPTRPQRPERGARSDWTADATGSRPRGDKAPGDPGSRRRPTVASGARPPRRAPGGGKGGAKPAGSGRKVVRRPQKG